MKFHLDKPISYLRRLKIPGLLICCLFFLHGVLSAAEIPPKPEPARYVNDYANLLSESDRQTLENKLVNYYDSTSTQLVVVIVSSLEGEEPWYYAQQLGEKWGVGKAEKDNGLVFLISKEDRKVFITTGYGLEDKITDAMAKRIITQQVTPNFKAGNYAEGINAALDRIISLCSGQYQADPEPEGGGLSLFQWIFLIMLVIYVLKVISSINKGGTYNRRGYNSFGPTWTSGGYWGGGGFGGGSSGGSFGGGSFGGGGAGGDW
jgi:uncharacterized protein